MSEVKLTIIDREGKAFDVTARAGGLLMHLLREQVDLTLGTCGGTISCGTCLVRLSPEWLAGIEPPGEDEAEMLEALDADGECRLSCQLTLDGVADGNRATIVPIE